MEHRKISSEGPNHLSPGQKSGVDMERDHALEGRSSGRDRGLSRARETSFVPAGLESFFQVLPAMKCWAKLLRPFGAGSCLYCSRFAIVALLFMFASGTLLAQASSATGSSGTLRGTVADPSGAVIPQATVTATSATGQKTSATTDNVGNYEIKGLAPGTYTVITSAKGFSIAVQQNVALVAGQTQKLDVALAIQVEREKVDVQDQGTNVDVSPSNNASSIIIKGKDLEALSDDPDELQTELQALAGPSAGPNGGQIYIDGFSGGQLPPKASIREIRINQNPFSAEYDKVGYGRIEVFTKPGTDHYHGQLMVSGNDSAFDSKWNPLPLRTVQPDYHTELYNGNVSGPIGKKASFFLEVQRRNINQNSLVDATVLDSNFNPVRFSQAISNPRIRTSVAPRIDVQLGQNNTLTARYEFEQNDQSNQGVGQFSLASRAHNDSETENTLQISDTQILSPNVVNETRFQYYRDVNIQVPQSTGFTTSVLGGFNGGGSPQGRLQDVQNHYELQNYTSIVHGKHFIKFGARLRGVMVSNQSTGNFNGTFTFPSIQAYRVTQQGLQAGLTPAQSRAACLAASPNPQTAQCGASQFSITSGQPVATVSLVDVGPYVQDDWRIRPNLTVSLGLRFESQNDIHDHADFAPRLGIAWGLGGGKNPPKTVVRAGYGIFYDRFTYDLVLQQDRLNGVTEQSTIVQSPDFYPTIPPTGTILGTQSPTIYRANPNLQSPSTMQTAVSIERQLSKSANVAVTYLNSRGDHQLITRNINAPEPGTFVLSDPSSGVRPYGGTTNIYQYDSEGIFRQNQLILNARVNLGAKLSLFGFYTLSYANSDTSGASSFPSNQYKLMQDYGRASFDTRHRLFLGGTVGLPYAWRLNPFLVINSGRPFDVTVGQDLNGDSIFNDRPAFASSSTPANDVIITSLGDFNIAPAVGDNLVPVNYGNSPTSFALNLRLSRTFGFGPEVKSGGGPGGPGGGGPGRGPEGGYGGGGRGGPPGGGLGGRGLTGAGGNPFGPGPAVNRRYSLTFSASARNIFNHTNLGPPVGNLDSRTLFGISNSLATGPFASGNAIRRIDLQMVFAF
jgi:hypothetical protein